MREGAAPLFGRARARYDPPGATDVKVLLADDEQSILTTLADDLVAAGHVVTTADDGEAALAALRRESLDCIVSDINMPGIRGIDLLRRAKEIDPRIQVVLMTGFGTIESAVEAMKLGAADYVTKPFYNDQIVQILARCERIRTLERENETLREQLEDVSGVESVIGRSEPMQKVLATVKTVARSDSSVLIVGETGTGKEVICRAIHSLSRRRQHPLVSLSCAAIPATLLEDELFGHEKGAYTDARERKIGRFERADHGTIFLDDIDDMPLNTQVKLLRVLQERSFERLGGERTIATDVRVIAATKVDLRKAVADGEFREDLFYRLNVVPIHLPPLRDRHGDVPLLAAHFMRKYGGGREYEIRPEVMEAMEAYYWPGNVRELEHAVERAIAFAGQGRILRREHLVEVSPEHRKALAVPRTLRTLKEAVDEAEKQHLIETLRLVHGHRAQAASVLGISRKSLWEKLRLHGIGE